ncbi:MAG TPA: enterochelin esterase domain-containing protein [Chthonomonadaceae bacterium]|nr:enterochelin esterase domain-containing protein [Chthonomonadaceae bacterium]
MTFVWRGTQNTLKVVLEGTLPNREMERPLVHLPKTDLWYHTERLPIDSRFTYDFVVTEEVGGKLQTQERLDPLNPRSFNDGSVGEFLLAPPQL